METVFLIWMGLTAGLVTAGGTFALITVIGIVPRLAGYTGTAAHICSYEYAIILGGGIGSLVDILEVTLGMNVAFLTLAGLGSGVFVGCLIMALAETLNVLPILCRRLRLVAGIRFLVAAMALGKCIGAWIYFTFME